jgi:competence protein ComEA
MLSRLVALLVALSLGGPAVSHAAQNAGTPPVVEKITAPVNLNTATAADLESLPGIGPRMAERIVEYRQKNGAFKKIEDLMNVKGIGEKNFLKLKVRLTVAAPKA